MKKSCAFIIVLMLTVLSSITSCNKEEIPLDPIVGIWEYSNIQKDFSISATLTFNEDKTGLSQVEYIIYGKPESRNSNFVYITSGSILTIIIGTEITETPYSISENQLSITYLGEDMVLTKKQI